MTPSTLVVLGAAIACGAVLLLAARRRPPAGRPGLFAAEEREHARDELTHLVTELQDVSRQQIAQLDTKIRMLQQLIADADARIRELRSLADRGGAPAARPANPLHDRVYALADAGRAVADICTETGLDEGDVQLILGLRQPASFHP